MVARLRSCADADFRHASAKTGAASHDLAFADLVERRERPDSELFVLARYPQADRAG